MRVEVKDPNDYQIGWKPGAGAQVHCQHQEMRFRDASVTGKMPDGSCILFDRDKATLEHKAAGEQGFSTAHKSKSLNTMAFHRSAFMAI